MENKTAVEWLEFWQNQREDLVLTKQDFDQAKALEKQQIVEAYNMATKVLYTNTAVKLGIETQPINVTNAEQYFESTYKTNL